MSQKNFHVHQVGSGEVLALVKWLRDFKSSKRNNGGKDSFAILNVYKSKFQCKLV